MNGNDCTYWNHNSKLRVYIYPYSLTERRILSKSVEITPEWHPFCHCFTCMGCKPSHQEYWILIIRLISQTRIVYLNCLNAVAVSIAVAKVSLEAVLVELFVSRRKMYDRLLWAYHNSEGNMQKRLILIALIRTCIKAFFCYT